MIFHHPLVPRETNLKFRQALTVTHLELTSPKKMASFHGKGMEVALRASLHLLLLGQDGGQVESCTAQGNPVPVVSEIFHHAVTHGKGPLPTPYTPAVPCLPQKGPLGAALAVCCGRQVHAAVPCLTLEAIHSQATEADAFFQPRPLALAPATRLASLILLSTYKNCSTREAGTGGSPA